MMESARCVMTGDSTRAAEGRMEEQGGTWQAAHMLFRLRSKQFRSSINWILVTKNAFQIHTPKKSLMFFAPDHPQKLKWVEHLSESIANSKQWCTHYCLLHTTTWADQVAIYLPVTRNNLTMKSGYVFVCYKSMNSPISKFIMRFGRV